MIGYYIETIDGKVFESICAVHYERYKNLIDDSGYNKIPQLYSFCVCYLHMQMQTLQSCSNFLSLLHIVQVGQFFRGLAEFFSLQVHFVIRYMRDR